MVTKLDWNFSALHAQPPPWKWSRPWEWGCLGSRSLNKGRKLKVYQQRLKVWCVFLSRFNLLVVFRYDLRFSTSIFLLLSLDIRFLSSAFVLIQRDICHPFSFFSTLTLVFEIRHYFYSRVTFVSSLSFSFFTNIHFNQAWRTIGTGNERKLCRIACGKSVSDKYVWSICRARGADFQLGGANAKA